MSWILSSLLIVFSSNWFLVLSNVLPTTSNSQDKLVFDCFSQNSSDFLTELRTFSSLQEIYLRGFVFDGENTVGISKCFINLQLKKISFVECDINDGLMSCFEFPDSLRSIRLERSTLSSEGIHSLISKLSSLMESIEIIKWTTEEPITQNASLSLARFSSLKRFQLENVCNFRIDICQMLISLSNIPLEIIKMSRIDLSSSEWKSVLQQWYIPNRKSLFNSLQILDFKIRDMYDDIASQFIQFLLSFPHLEVLCFKKNWASYGISIPKLPLQLRQFMLSGFGEVFLNDSNSSIYNSQSVSGLTHLSVCGRFEIFPYELLKLNQLECLKIRNIESKEIVYSLSTEDSFDSLKHLSIQAYHLYPLLPKFNFHFPSIESISIYSVYSKSFDCYLNEILSSKTLKRLSVNYFGSENDLILKEELISTIEELELNFVDWNFVSLLLQRVKFFNLKTFILNTTDSLLDLDEILEELSRISQLSSLTLSCNFLPRKSDEAFPFFFNNLTFFSLDCYNNLFKLDHLFSCMPKLIEFKVKYEIRREFEIESATNIRFLSLPLSYSLNRNIFINLIKSMPNLMEFTNYSMLNCFQTSNELSFYLKTLKKYFRNELKFQIDHYCLPMYLLKKDSDLLKLVQGKSSKLADYLERTYRLNKHGDTFIELLFRTEIPNLFDNINPTLLVTIVQLLFELGRNPFNTNDILFMEMILLADERDNDFELSVEPIEYSPDHFHLSFVNYLQCKTKVKFNSYYFNFTKEWINANESRYFQSIYSFLRHFFSLLQKTNETIGYELFNLFSECILNNSYRSLIDKIRDEKLSQKEKRALLSIQFTDFNNVSLKLQTLSEEEYKQMISRFDSMLFEIENNSLFERFMRRLGWETLEYD